MQNRKQSDGGQAACGDEPSKTATNLDELLADAVGQRALQLVHVQQQALRLQDAQHNLQADVVRRLGVAQGAVEVGDALDKPVV